MAAVTAAVAGVASAASGIIGARKQDKAQRRAEQRLSQGMFDNVSSSGPFGSTTWQNGRLTQQLSPEMEQQMNLFSNLAQNYSQPRDFGLQAQEFLGLQGQVAGMQPDAGSNFFANLQGMIGGNMDTAQGQIGTRLGQSQQLDQQGMGLMGQAMQQFGDIGTADQVRGDVLGLLREQAAPFEQRAFSNLQNNQFATGRLGSSGGALQTEAFARGLAQADTDRQLKSFQEGRLTQNNALNLGLGLSNAGAGRMTLGQNLLQNAFSNWGNFAGMASDVEGQRFGQEMGVQQNFFDQLRSMTGQSMGIEGFQQQSQMNDLGMMLRLFGAANAIPGMLSAQGQDALRYQGTQSNAAIGAGTATGGLQMGGGADAWGSLFSGIGTAAQGGGFDWLGNLFKPSAPASGGTPGMNVPS